jgi:hypothetical protein
MPARSPTGRVSTVETLDESIETRCVSSFVASASATPAPGTPIATAAAGNGEHSNRSEVSHSGEPRHRNERRAAHASGAIATV